jgi:hypothetical protein
VDGTGATAIRPAAALILLLALAGQASSTPAAPGVAPDSKMFEGFARFLVIDSEVTHTAEISLELDDGTLIPVAEASRSTFDAVRPGERVTLEGHLDAMGALVPLSAPQVVGPSDSAPAENFGEQVTIGIMANFRNDNSQPKTKQDVESVIMGSGDKIVREYSYGQAWITLNVTGWHTMDIDKTCDQNAILQPAIDAADPTVDFKPYKRITILFPGSCSYAGVATVGSRTVNTQDGQIKASILWMPSAGWRASVWVHEHGHNFGVWHANSLSCGGKSFGEVGPSGCTTQDYGDPWESMGNKATAHYDSFHKRIIGWLWENRSVTATKGTFDIDPIAKLPGAIAEVVVPYDTITYYTVEMRIPFGEDTGETGNLYRGSVIHYANWRSSTGDSHIIDAAFGTSSQTDAALEAGQTYKDTMKNIDITTISVGANSLRVRIGPDTGDSDPPVVKIVFPVDQGGVGSTSITVNGTASDNTGVGEVQVSINGAAFAKASGTASWDFQGTVKGGANGICARAFDASGNMGQHCVTAWLDQDPPTVAIASPKDGDFSNTTAVQVAGTAKDDVRLDKVELQVDGGPWSVATGTTQWNGQVTLPGGASSICARATDTATKVSQPACVKVSVDARPPEVNIITPKDGGAVAQPDATITGNASDDLALDRVEVQLNGGAWTPAAGSSTWSAQLTFIQGANTVCARAFDKAGKSATTTACPKVTLDQTPPTVKITTPADGANVPAEGLEVKGTASDNHKVERVEVQVSGGAWKPANGTTSWTTVVDLPSAGSNTICARATDAAGTQSTGTDCITVDSRPPRVLADVKVSPSSSDLDPGKSLLLAAEAIDSEGKPFEASLIAWKWSVVEGKGSVDQAGRFTATNQSGKSVVKVTGTFGATTKDATAEIYVGGGAPKPGGGIGSVMAFLTSPLFIIIIVLLIALIAAGAIVSARRMKKQRQVYPDPAFPQT